MADQDRPLAEDAGRPSTNEATHPQEPRSSSSDNTSFPFPSSPRMTLSRRHKRLQDHAEYLRNRFFDGNPDAKAEYTTHKSQRNNTWAAMDDRKAASCEDVSRTDISADALARSKTFDPPPSSASSAGKRQPNKLRRRPTAQPSAEDTSSTQVEPPSKPGSPPGSRKGPRLSLLVGAIHSLKRRNRRRSDVRPGFFRPEARDDGERRGVQSPGDQLEMNLPFEAVPTPTSESRSAAEGVLGPAADEREIRMVDREGKGKEVARAESPHPDPSDDGNKKSSPSQGAPGTAM